MSTRLRGFLSLGAIILAGCVSQVRVSPVSSSPDSLQPAHAGRLSWWQTDSRCEQLVDRYGWQSLMQSDPDLVLRRLLELASTNSTTDEVAAVAELAQRYGQEL